MAEIPLPVTPFYSPSAQKFRENPDTLNFNSTRIEELQKKKPVKAGMASSVNIVICL